MQVSDAVRRNKKDTHLFHTKESNSTEQFNARFNFSVQSLFIVSIKALDSTAFEMTRFLISFILFILLFSIRAFNVVIQVISLDHLSK